MKFPLGRRLIGRPDRCHRRPVLLRPGRHCPAFFGHALELRLHFLQRYARLRRGRERRQEQQKQGVERDGTHARAEHPIPGAVARHAVGESVSRVCGSSSVYRKPKRAPTGRSALESAQQREQYRRRAPPRESRPSPNATARTWNSACRQRLPRACIPGTHRGPGRRVAGSYAERDGAEALGLYNDAQSQPGDMHVRRTGFATALLVAMVLATGAVRGSPPIA